MATLRTYDVSVTHVLPKLRTYDVSVAHTAAAGLGPLRTFSVSVTHTAIPVLVDLPDQTDVEPAAQIQFTAVSADGGALDSATWTQTAGPTATLAPSGLSCIVTAPYLMPGAASSIVISVVGHRGTANSLPVTATITVLPQLSWAWDPVGLAWKGGLSYEL
jgi:hypothetical protein